ncbi:MAG: redoxin domain-containing protein [Flavobacteriales bacterium]|nr:redoxin domain-containing protein [Flavobacteriales bacterium]
MKTVIAIFLFILPFVAIAQKQKLKVGKKAPSFELKNQTGELISLEKLLEEKESLVVMFYIGSWNKYDKDYLADLQSVYPQIQNKNAELVAITRETSHFISQAISEGGLEFPICMDNEWYVISAYGCANKISSGYLPQKHKEFSKMNATHTGSKDDVIPVPATFIIGKDGKVKWTHFDPDYRQRPKVEDVLENL